MAFGPSGDWGIRGILDASDFATDAVIVKNGVKLVQEGDVLPDIAPWKLTNFNGGLHIAVTGDVLWYGRWDNPDSTIDEGLFINHELIVQEGVTTVGGEVLTSLSFGLTDTRMISPNGQYVIFEARIDPGGGALDVAVLLNRGGLTAVGCHSYPNSLYQVSGGPRLGQTLGMELAGPGPAAFMAITWVPGVYPCGVPTGFGDVLIGLAPPPFIIKTDLAFPFTFTQKIPNDPTLVGDLFYIQGGSAPTLSLSNGFILEIGPPD